jgi:hypothetical protein
MGGPTLQISGDLRGGHGSKFFKRNWTFRSDPGADPERLLGGLAALGDDVLQVVLPRKRKVCHERK